MIGDGAVLKTAVASAVEVCSAVHRAQYLSSAALTRTKGQLISGYIRTASALPQWQLGAEHHVSGDGHAVQPLQWPAVYQHAHKAGD